MLDVLIIGAGPTGLVLALWLRRQGIAFRIVDEAPEAGTASRALVVHARTLEFYAMAGIAEAAIAGGLTFAAANVWARRRRVARLSFGDIGRGLSAFPYMLILPQDAHERILAAGLSRLGVTVERGIALAGIEETADGVAATLRHADGREERAGARFIAGCDGARSTLRHLLGIGFPGGTYEEMFYVADVEGRGERFNAELHVCLEPGAFAAVFPLRAPGQGRLVGILPPGAPEGGAAGWVAVAAHVRRHLGLEIDRVNWFSTYRVHHRVARSFRRGRAFLLGDAAHIHSPAGGQGMNTGIGDAVNLGWKLGAVLRGADPALLASYEAERRAFAELLVRTTDRGFRAGVSGGALAVLLRNVIAPALLPWLSRLVPVRRFAFRTLSQTRISWRASPLSEGRAGRLAAGDRLPYAEGAGGHSHEGLDGLAWQALVLAEPSPALAAECAARGLRLRRLPQRLPGVPGTALLLLRPDGHVGFAAPVQDAAGLARYLDARGFRGAALGVPEGAAA